MKLENMENLSYKSLDDSVTINLDTFYEKSYNRNGRNKIAIVLALSLGGPKTETLKITTNLRKITVAYYLQRYTRITPNNSLTWKITDFDDGPVVIVDVAQGIQFFIVDERDLHLYKFLHVK